MKQNIHGLHFSTADEATETQRRHTVELMKPKWTSQFKSESELLTNFSAVSAKPQLMKWRWTGSQQLVLPNYWKLFLRSRERRFWLDSDWLPSAAEPGWRLIALLFVSLRRLLDILFCAEASLLQPRPCRTSKEPPQPRLTSHVVASEHRQSLSSSSLHIESRLLSQRLMKTLHSISSTLSSSSTSPQSKCIGFFLIRTIIRSCLLLSITITLSCFTLNIFNFHLIPFFCNFSHPKEERLAKHRPRSLLSFPLQSLRPLFYFVVLSDPISLVNPSIPPSPHHPHVIRSIFYL